MRKGLKIQIGLRLLLASCAIVMGNITAFALVMFFPIINPISFIMGITPEEQAKADLLKDIKDQTELMIRAKGFLTAEEVTKELEKRMAILKDIDIDKLKEALGESDKGLRAIALAQGTKITELEAKLAKRENDNVVKNVRAQVAEFMEKNKTSIDAIRSGAGGHTLPNLEIRAAITMTDSASLGGSAYLPRTGVQPGIIDLVRVQPTFWDYLKKGATKLVNYVWVNKTNKQGNATFIGEGVLKALASFELSTEVSVPKKVAERMKASTELLSDVDGMTTFIEDELRFEVDTACNAAVLTGTATSTNPKGVTKYGTLFTLTSLTGTVAPNNFDAILAAITQIRSLNFNGALTAFMNPIDIAKMNLAKSTQGVYVIPPFINQEGTVVNGVAIVEDNNIAVGYLLIGDMSKYRVLMYQDYTVSWGWENDDFSKNLMTVIGERRFHQWVSANHAGAFIYDTFANIKTALA